MSEAGWDLLFWVVALGVLFLGLRWMQRRRGGSGDETGGGSAPYSGPGRREDGDDGGD